MKESTKNVLINTYGHLAAKCLVSGYGTQHA